LYPPSSAIISDTASSTFFLARKGAAQCLSLRASPPQGEQLNAFPAMPLDPEVFVPIPNALRVVLWCELVLFVPFSLLHYCGPFIPFWAQIASNPIARNAIWSGEMLNGVGAFVLMYMLASALWTQSVSLIEVEILCLSHALWYGVVIAFSPPGPAMPFVVAFNPHTYLCIAVVATAYDMPRPICWILSPHSRVWALSEKVPGAASGVQQAVRHIAGPC
jgi:hypothetical protein